MKDLVTPTVIRALVIIGGVVQYQTACSAHKREQRGSLPTNDLLSSIQFQQQHRITVAIPSREPRDEPPEATGPFLVPALPRTSLLLAHEQSFRLTQGISSRVRNRKEQSGRVK